MPTGERAFGVQQVDIHEERLRGADPDDHAGAVPHLVSAGLTVLANLVGLHWMSETTPNSGTCRIVGPCASGGACVVDVAAADRSGSPVRC